MHRSGPRGTACPEHSCEDLGLPQPASASSTHLTFTTGWVGEGEMRWAVPLGSRRPSSVRYLLLLVTLPCRLPLCSPEYVALLRGTQALSTEELQALSRQFDAVYFHPVRALGTPPPTHSSGDLGGCQHPTGCHCCLRHWPGPFCPVLGALQPGSGLGCACEG